MSLGSLVVSTGYMGLFCALGQLARRLNERLTRQGLVQELINEAIAAAELCSCCFELIIGKYKQSENQCVDLPTNQWWVVELFY